jgi:hypothetical protein
LTHRPHRRSEIVRAEFHKSYPAAGEDKAAARKKAFRRAIGDAHAKGMIGSRDIGATTRAARIKVPLSLKTATAPSARAASFWAFPVTA